MLSKKPWFIKINSWEYWPNWILYTPVFIQHFWLALKAKNLFFFLRTNPAINGFILSDSKCETFKLVPDIHKPKTVLIVPEDTQESINKKFRDNQLDFPVILKPDIGFRGLLVTKVDDMNMLLNTISKKKIPFAVQEYVSYPFEIGIFYYRFPNTSSGVISSITIKEFLINNNGEM